MIRHDLSNADYHATSAISKSTLDRAHKSAAHWMAPSTPPTVAMSFGTAFHSMVLEPEDFNAQCAVSPALDRRTKAGKEAWSRFEQENEGKAIITSQECEAILAMKDAVQKHPKGRYLFSGGKAEVSAFWQDSQTGLECKCRPDYVTSSGLLVDLKSTQDASPEGFAKSAAKFRYHVQAAWYLNGWQCASGEKPLGFLFVAVEKQPPYNVGLYMLDPESLELGWRTATSDLNKIKRWMEEADWKVLERSGYSPDIVELKLPAWAFMQEI